MPTEEQLNKSLMVRRIKEKGYDRQSVEKEKGEFIFLQGRMSSVIFDVIAHMKACEISKEEIMKLLLQYMQQIVDFHFEEEA